MSKEYVMGFKVFYRDFPMESTRKFSDLIEYCVSQDDVPTLPLVLLSTLGFTYSPENGDKLEDKRKEWFEELKTHLADVNVVLGPDHLFVFSHKITDEGMDVFTRLLSAFMKAEGIHGPVMLQATAYPFKDEDDWESKLWGVTDQKIVSRYIAEIDPSMSEELEPEPKPSVKRHMRHR